MFILGITSLLSASLGFISFALWKKLYELQTKQKELLENLNSYSNMEQMFEREKAHIQEKYNQIINEKERYINEIRQSYSMQIKEIKNEYEIRIAKQKKDYDDIIQKLEYSARESFTNIANNLLEQKGKNLQEISNHNIQNILEPFKADITNFKQLIHTIHTERTQQHASLEMQIQSMYKHEQEMMQTTINLTKALKGENKTQGNWGEMILRKILNDSGLIEGKHYTEQGKQMDLKNEDGKREQPDFIINLPQEKHIIVDSKVSLTHYERFCSNGEKADIDSFVASIETHIKQLAEKKYHDNQKLNTPDFTIMFLPIEGAYFLAVQHKQEIWEMAWKKRIALCCPSNLWPMLKTIANIWAIDMQNKNAKDIVSRANEMYKKFNGFLSTLDDVGKNLDRARDSYNKAQNQLTIGSGNLNGQFQKMISMVKLDGTSSMKSDVAIENISE